MDKLKLLDLFSGIGGFSLGLERTGGFETAEIEPSARSSHSPERYSTNTGRRCLAMKTSETLPLPGLLPMGSGELKRSAQGSLVRTLAQRERKRGLKESAPAFGAKLSALLASYDQTSSSWRTQQSCLIEGLATFSENWPRGGTMQSGSVYPQQALERPTVGIGYGLLPTPPRTANHLAPAMQKHAGMRKLSLMYVPTPNAGSSHWGGSWRELGGSGNPLRGTEFGTLKIHPWEWEWMMGYPRDWTDCER